MYNKKRVLNELYEIKVSQTISLKTIYHFQKLLNNDNFETKSEIKKQLEVFVSHENLNSLYLEDKHIMKGKEYLIKKYLTKDKNNFRQNKEIVFSDLLLAAILKYNKNIRFLFMGYAKFSNGFYEHYEPIYQLILYDDSFEIFYQVNYAHHNCKDYEIDLEEENIIQNDKFSLLDERLYIGEIIRL